MKYLQQPNRFRKCGIIFNGHQWRLSNIASGYRICEKCGECQEFFYGEWKDGWVTIDFDRMIRSINERQAHLKAELERDASSRRKALDYLKDN